MVASPISNVRATNAPVATFFAKFPTTWPLVRETLPVALNVNVFAPVVILPAVNVSVPLTVMPEESVAPCVSLSCRFVNEPPPESACADAPPLSRIVPAPVWLPESAISPFAVIVPDGVNVAVVPIVNVPATVTEPEAVTVAEAATDRLLKVNVPELEIDAPLFIVIVPPDGANTAVVPTLNAPPTLKLLDVVTVAAFATVNPLKVNVPELAMDEPLFIVIVPLEGANTAVVPMESAPPTVKLLAVVTVAAFAMVKLLNVNEPELEIEAPLFIVIAPAEAVNVAPVPTLRTPPMLTSLEVEEVAELAIVRLLKVSVPAEFTMDEPLFIVIVPEIGVNVPVTVNALRTVALFDAPVIEPLTLRPPYVRFERI